MLADRCCGVQRIAVEFGSVVGRDGWAWAIEVGREWWLVRGSGVGAEGAAVGGGEAPAGWLGFYQVGGCEGLEAGFYGG